MYLHKTSTNMFKHIANFFAGGKRGCAAGPATDPATDPAADTSWEDTITYIPPVTSGRVIKVYDGDTITIATRVHGLDQLYRFSVRLDGIDCPEMRTKSDTEKSAAKLAKQFVAERVLGKMVELRDVSLEKYGRILADVWIDGQSINTQLVEHRLAVTYGGGTKQIPGDWLEYHLKGSL
jgi:endonuclease YncB( thermonuclease family)